MSTRFLLFAYNIYYPNGGLGDLMPPSVGEGEIPTGYSSMEEVHRRVAEEVDLRDRDYNVSVLDLATGIEIDLRPFLDELYGKK